MSKDRISHYLCIDCPLGCRLEVEENDNDNTIEVRGFTCKKGKNYGLQEHTDPRRMVTTSVFVKGGVLEKLPVRTNASVPKNQVLDVCRALQAITVTAPVNMGQVIVNDVLGSGADVIASRDIPAATP